jgi:hypothetical protein
LQHQLSRGPFQTAACHRSDQPVRGRADSRLEVPVVYKIYDELRNSSAASETGLIFRAVISSPSKRGFNDARGSFSEREIWSPSGDRLDVMAMTGLPPRQRARERSAILAELKTRQAFKIREIRDALTAAGFVVLDEQAKALGVSRSTAWNILNGTYKSSGLSVAIINRMLAAPRLPPLVRTKILEYIREKTAGCYGHSNIQLRKFSSRLVTSRLGQDQVDAKMRNDPKRFSPRSRSRRGP